MKRPNRRAVAALVLAAAVPALAGCQLFSPTTTDLNYDPASGVTAHIGEVVGRDLVVVGEKGSDGVVSGALVNNGTTDAQVTIETKGQPQPVKVDVPPGELVTLGGADAEATVVVGNLNQMAGTLMDVTFSSPSGGKVVTAVPVLLPRFSFETVTPPAN